MASGVRPMGVLGSSIAVLVGAWFISGLFMDDEDYSAGFKAKILVISAILIGTGVLGLVAAWRSRHPDSQN